MYVTDLVTVYPDTLIDYAVVVTTSREDTLNSLRPTELQILDLHLKRLDEPAKGEIVVDASQSSTSMIS